MSPGSAGTLFHGKRHPAEMGAAENAARNYYGLGTYSINCPSGRVIAGPPKGSYWRVSEDKFWEMDRDEFGGARAVTTCQPRRFSCRKSRRGSRLAALSEEVGDERSLLVYCMAFRGGAAAFANLTVKKIPNAVLHRWSRDDYSLQVATLPPAPEPERAAATPLVQPRRRQPAPALPLFEGSA